MGEKDEQSLVKPMRKYPRQVWLKDGGAIIVDPIENEDPKDHPNYEKKWRNEK